MALHAGFIIVIISTIVVGTTFCKEIDILVSSNDSDGINRNGRVPRASKAERKSEAACREYISRTPTTRHPLIVDGVDLGNDKFPHMALLGYESSDFQSLLQWRCDASLIHPRFVLTSAHCLVNVDDVLPKVARFGFIDSNLPVDESVPEVEVVNYTVHPDFNHKTKQNDIALIELSKDVTTNGKNVNPACLYQSNDDPTDLIIAHRTIIESETDKEKTILQKVAAEAVDLENCTITYTKWNANITSKQICYLVSNGDMVDTCEDFFGEPVQKLISPSSDIYVIVGVPSYSAYGCGERNGPGIYTRVSSYIDWIESIVWP